MGNAGNGDYQRFETAVRTNSFKVACRVARDLPYDLDLSDTLRLTILAAKKEPERFEAFAQRWITVAMEAELLRLDDLPGVAMHLRWVRDGLDDGAELVRWVMSRRGMR